MCQSENSRCLRKRRVGGCGCVCGCVCARARASVRVRTCVVFVGVRTCVYARAYVCMYACECVCACVCVRACGGCVGACVSVCVCLCVVCVWMRQRRQGSWEAEKGRGRKRVKDKEEGKTGRKQSLRASAETVVSRDVSNERFSSCSQLNNS